MKHLSLLLLILAVLGTGARPASGQQATPEQKSELTKLREQRDAKTAEAKKATDEAAALDKQYKAMAFTITHPGGKLPSSLAAAPAVAPDPSKEDFFKWAKKHLQVRQSITDTKFNSLPALAQYTLPASGHDSRQVDAGIAITGQPFDTLSADGRVYSEYHYNDAAKALKDTFLAGADMDFVFSGLSDAEAIQAIKDGDIVPGQILRLGAAFKRDNLVAGQGLQANATWIPDFPPLFGGYWQELGWITGRLEPSLGIQYEDGNGATGFKDGQRTSFHANLSLEGYLLPRQLGNRLQYNAGIEYWNHFDTTGLYRTYARNQQYFTSALTYWLLSTTGQDGKPDRKEPNAGLTIKYVNGDNATTGDFDANTWTFGLSVQF